MSSPSSSSSAHVDEALAAVASAVAQLQHRLRLGHGQDDVDEHRADDLAAATMTVAMEPEEACGCAKHQDGGVAVIKLTGSESDGGEVQLVAKYLLSILKKQGMLSEVRCACGGASPKEAAELPVSGAQGAGAEVESDESLDEDEDDDSKESEYPEEVPKYSDFSEMQRRVTLDLSSLSRQGPTAMTKAKVTLLTPHLLQPVRKLINLYCDVDSAWVLQMLYDLAPQLEELQMVMPSPAHLEVMETMPQLSRLDIEYYDGNMLGCGSPQGTETTRKNYVFKRVPAKHCGLRFLRIGHVPKKNMFSLVRAHHKTLEELWLCVGTGNPGVQEENRWPESCHNLHVKLGRYAGTWPLERLVLYRWRYAHNKENCSAQVHALQQVLLGVNVQCYECDELSYGDF